jgi:hypothetical protein
VKRRTSKRRDGSGDGSDDNCTAISTIRDAVSQCCANLSWWCCGTNTGRNEAAKAIHAAVRKLSSGCLWARWSTKLSTIFLVSSSQEEAAGSCESSQRDSAVNQYWMLPFLLLVVIALNSVQLCAAVRQQDRTTAWRQQWDRRPRLRASCRLLSTACRDCLWICWSWCCVSFLQLKRCCS